MNNSKIEINNMTKDHNKKEDIIKIEDNKKTEVNISKKEIPLNKNQIMRYLLMLDHNQ
jgi:hypothetical protein